MAPTANPGPAPIAIALTGYSGHVFDGEDTGVIVAVLVGVFVADVEVEVGLEPVAVTAVFLFKTHVVFPAQV